jgi:hypothetical protein
VAGAWGLGRGSACGLPGGRGEDAGACGLDGRPPAGGEAGAWTGGGGTDGRGDWGCGGGACLVGAVAGRTGPFDGLVTSDFAGSTGLLFSPGVTSGGLGIPWPPSGFRPPAAPVSAGDGSWGDASGALSVT